MALAQSSVSNSDPNGFRNATSDTEELLTRLTGKAPGAELVSKVLECIKSSGPTLTGDAAQLVVFHELYPRRDSQALTATRHDKLVTLTYQLLGRLAGQQVQPEYIRAFGFHLYLVGPRTPGPRNVPL